MRSWLQRRCSSSTTIIRASLDTSPKPYSRMTFLTLCWLFQHQPRSQGAAFFFVLKEATPLFVGWPRWNCSSEMGRASHFRNGSEPQAENGGTPKSSKLNQLCIETHGGSPFLRNPPNEIVAPKTTGFRRNHNREEEPCHHPVVVACYCCLLLVACYWLLAGCRLQVAGFWLFVACSLFLVACRLPLAACCLLPAALLPGGGGCWIVAVNHKGNRSITEDRDTGDLGTHRETEGKTNLDDKFSATAKSSQERNSQRETEGRQKWHTRETRQGGSSSQQQPKINIPRETAGKEKGDSSGTAADKPA